ncbi:MAG: zf-HC2 domain-containing protein, partial [Deltaproteobacteria bacterium]|nr:zf-HC2 domain-containing protein [Deltaproteobacteria bacterium]
MDTFFARNRLSAYLDGELSAAEAREVEAAIARDAGLRAELEQMRAAIELLRAEGLVSAPVGFAARVRDRVDDEPMRVGWRLWVTQIRPEAVMLAAAALLVVVYVGHRREHPPATIPGTEAVATGGAFGGDEGGVEGSSEPGPPGEVQAAAPPVDTTDAVASGSTMLND